MHRIDLKEFERLRNEEGTVVINVLERDSFERAHIPESINIPNSDDDFHEQVEEAAPSKDTNIVVYCADEECQASPAAARKLTEAGYINVYDFEAGLKGWRKAGHELEGERQRIESTG